MNEPAPPLENPAQAQPAPAAAPAGARSPALESELAPRRTRDREDARAAWLAVVLAAVATLLGWFALQRAGDLEARLNQERADSQGRELRNAERDRELDELRRQWNLAQSESDVAGGQVTDAELRKRRETLALIDVERLVEQTQLQLRLGAPVGAAADVLGAADARLARLSTPAAARVQTALRHDLARLKAAPDVDRGLLAARLDPLLDDVNRWHVSADPTHPSQRPPGPVAARATAAGEDTVGARVRDWISREFGDLLRIREIDTPEALRLGPVQQQLLRDRFRLGILDLREAILARDERTIRAEEAALEALLSRYFDPNQAEVGAAIAQLRATAAAALAGGPPSLDETLAALRAARPGGG